MSLRTLRRAEIVGVGMYAPERVLTNLDLEKMVDTTDEWIFSRTGIRERRIAAENQATSDLAVAAAKKAMETAGVTAQELDLIVVATCTGDMNTFPATATIVQDKLGAKKAAAFDVAAVCSGFAYAVDVAAQFIETGRYETVLVIGAEVLSRVTDWTDRNTCVLFGDGAGAVVLRPSQGEAGLIGSVLGTDGTGVCLLNVPGGGSAMPLTAERLAEGQQYIKMAGREVYRFAVEIMGEAARQALTKVGMTAHDIDLFIPHQANVRIIDAAAKRLELPSDKVFVNVDRYGNTSAASIAMGMVEAWQSGRIAPGSLVVTVGFGAGLTWGANVIRWGDLKP